MTQNSGLDGRVLLDEYAQQRRRGRRIILIAMLVLLAGIIIQYFRYIPAPELDTSKLGIHLLLDDGHSTWPVDLWDDHLAAAESITSSGGIAVELIRADDLNPERWQHFIDLAERHDLTPVLRLATTYDYENQRWYAPQPDDDGSYHSWAMRYAEFLNALDWLTEEKTVILLNEPNNGHEWGGQPDPAAYARFVVDVGTVLREQVEGVVILNAALDLYAPNTGSLPFPGTDVFYMDANTFMDRMQAEQPGIFMLFDMWNSHPYPIAMSKPPSEQVYHFDFLNDAVDTTITPPDGIFNRGINGYTWELWKLQQFGVDDIPVMITETGWRHSEATPPESRDSGLDYVDAQTAARYIDLALRGQQSPFAAGAVTWMALLADERVAAVAPFALNGLPDEWGHSNWLKLDHDGVIVGVYPSYDRLASYSLR